LFGRDSETGQVAFGVDWSFLDTGRVRARIAAADADGEAALAAYEQAVLAALEETANALARYQRAGEEAGRLAESAQAAAQAAQLAHVRHDAGAADLLDVLDAERTRLMAEDAAADAAARRAIGAVAVYSALAGGWPQQPPARVRLESGRQAAVAP
jgi:outer membrane protein TolC